MATPWKLNIRIWRFFPLFLTSGDRKPPKSLLFEFSVFYFAFCEFRQYKKRTAAACRPRGISGQGPLLLGLGIAMHWPLTLGRGLRGRIKFTDGSAALCMAFIACWPLSLLGFFCSRFWDPTMSWNSFFFCPTPLFSINIISSCR